MLVAKFLPIFLLLSLPAHAAAPSGEEWLTLNSPHFRVHHTPALEVYARALTRALEYGLPLLQKDLNWQIVHQPVDIVVMDSSDRANGFAVNFPNTHIEVYAAPFEADSTLGHYVNWVNELGVHELTHIVANDMSRGFFSTLRTIFGSWVKPNGLEPTWLSEGLAVYEETSHTTGGRGRSPLLEAMLRTAFLEGMLTSANYSSLDRFNDGNPWWPSGNMAYLFGYTIQALPTKERPGVPGRVAFENSGIFPFGPNTAAELATGHDWYSIWDSAPGRLAPRYGDAAPQAAPCPLTRSGSFTGGQAVSTDGWIYYSEQDWDHGNHLARVRADAGCGEGKVERLTHKNESGPTQVAVSPNGKLVAYAAFDRQRLDRFFSDIYLWKSESSSQERLTDGARLRDPAFADDNNLLYVRTHADTSQAIVKRELATNKETEVFMSRPLERISGLFARGDQVLFSLHLNNGQERIQKLTLSTGKTEPAFPGISAKRAYERNPYLAADGTIFFAGAFDNSEQEIYRFSPQSKTLKKVATSRSGYLDRPVLLADGKTLIVQEYGLNGLNLARKEVAEAEPAPATTREDLHEFLSGEKIPAEEVSSSETYPASVPYDPLRTPATSLWPQYWLPDFAVARDGSLIGALTTGNDPLEYHSYGIGAQYDTRTNFPTYLAYYRNRTNLVNFLFRANQYNDYFWSSRSSNRVSTYSAQAILPIGESAYSFGAALHDRSLFGTRAQNVIMFQNFSHAEVGQRPSAVTPNFGHLVNVYLGLYPNARNDNFFADFRPTAALYFEGFHPSHSFSIAAQAGISTNSLLASNYYLGGGASSLQTSSFIVRGYPTDVLFGQRIGTANLNYSIPLAHIYHGLGTNPVFLETLGLRFDGDVGTANYMARYINGSFYRYGSERYAHRFIAGVGADILAQGSILYHIPATITAGLHRGFDKSHGGDTIFVFGLNIGSLGPLGKRDVPVAE